MVALGTLATCCGSSNSSRAFDVSADGKTIVGRTSIDGGNTAFVWDEIHGMRDLMTVLLQEGVDLMGWTSFFGATGISGDGRMITGYGNGPLGTEAFVIYLPEQQIPATTNWTLGFGAVILAIVGVITLKNSRSFVGPTNPTRNGFPMHGIKLKGHSLREDSVEFRRNS